MGDLKINFSYPYSEDYEYVAEMVRVNLDQKREESILTNSGFAVTSVQQSLKKNLKDPNGIFSTRYGQTIQDVNPFADRHKCECGYFTSRIHNNLTCPICNTKVRYVDDDFKYFGWITLKDPYYIIQPNIFKSIEFFIGKEFLQNILIPHENKDQDGFLIEEEEQNKEEPFFGIGMMGFKDRYLEILDFYKKKNPKKEEYYHDLLSVLNETFTQSIPVFTIHLRPFKADAASFRYEDTNGIYNMMTKLAHDINRDNLKMYRKKKSKNKLLYDLNVKYSELYKKIEEILQGKKGTFRGVFGGRYNFSSRSVIVANPALRIDEITLSYFGLVELLQQTIVNLLQKTYTISYSEAYAIWQRSKIKKDMRVYNIIKGLIKDKPRGIPIIINRNPTIAYGGILQMFVVDICDNYTMSLPLQILPLLAADFDGDVINILYIINKSFFEASFKTINPRNCMQISKNDGKFNNDINHTKDILINLNSMIMMARKSYSQEQLDRIARAKQIL